MTLQEAKDQVALFNGFPAWKDIDFRLLDEQYSITSPPFIKERLNERAAILYAKSKWQEACEAYEQRLIELDKPYLVAKPEFKP